MSYTKKIIIFIIVTATTICSINPFSAKALLSKQDLARQSIIAITKELEAAIENNMEKIAKEIKYSCSKNGWDYYLTMQSFYNQENPYINSDYIKLIAAYSIAKEYTDTLKISDFSSLPFVKSDVTTQYIEDYETIRYGKELSTEKVKIPYGEVHLSGINYEDIFTIYGIDFTDDNIKKLFTQKTKEYESLINNKGIQDSLFINLSQEMLNNEDRKFIRNILEGNIAEDRKNVIATAVSLIGKVPYQWGGKPRFAGYDNTWWTIGSDGKQKGLDCSGFIQWCFMTSGYDSSIYNKLLSTSSILANTETITIEELEPGDMGLLHNGNNDKINHVGIYLGDGKWIHCSSGNKTVTIEKTKMFSVYKKFPDDIEKEEIVETNNETTEELSSPIYNYVCNYSDEDILLVAKLIANEAEGEGLNGWIAVAEVVKNRIESDIFPNTVKEVIYQRNQFADNDRIATREPSEKMITVAKEVMSGNMSIFNRSDILFFRNAHGSKNNWGRYMYFDTINNHQFYSYIPK